MCILHFVHYFQSVLGTACTDTEKHLEILQAENERLLQELSDAKSAQTKAQTVSKLNGHRQQVGILNLSHIHTLCDASAADDF